MAKFTLNAVAGAVELCGPNEAEGKYTHIEKANLRCAGRAAGTTRQKSAATMVEVALDSLALVLLDSSDASNAAPSVPVCFPHTSDHYLLL